MKVIIFIPVLNFGLDYILTFWVWSSIV